MIYFFLRWVLKGDNEYIVLKCCLQKNSWTAVKSWVLFNRMRCLFRVLALPVFLRFRFKSDDLFFLDSENGGEINQARSSFLKLYLGKRGAPFHIKNGIHIANIRSLGIFFYAYIISLMLAVIGLFDRSKWNFNFVSMALMHWVKIEVEDPSTLIFFKTSRLDHYLLSLYEGIKGKRKLYFVLGNSFLYTKQRYGIFKNIEIIFCSKVQRVEFNSYVENHWIHLDNIQFSTWGNESVDTRNGDRTIVFDLGYYSSAEWARTETLDRCLDIDAIRSGRTLNTNVWSELQKLIKGLINFSKENNKKMCIYLHPYEKELIERYNIYPPFMEQIDNKRVFLDNVLSVRSNLYSSKVGVTYISSIIMDRLHLDAPIYFPGKSFLKDRGISYTVPVKFLGEYRKYSWDSIDDLMNSLHKEFS